MFEFTISVENYICQGVWQLSVIFLELFRGSFVKFYEFFRNSPERIWGGGEQIQYNWCISMKDLASSSYEVFNRTCDHCIILSWCLYSHDQLCLGLNSQITFFSAVYSDDLL